MQAFANSYDYAVVCAGSAGCVLANRLSADPATRVLLLEAGPRNNNVFLKIPAGISKIYVHPTLNWGYSTEAEPNLFGRRLYWPRGKTLGGSSAISGMIYIRGQAEDYDHWAALGNPGWDWQDVLPLFKHLEYNERGADTMRGDNDEPHVADPRYRHPSSEAFIRAAIKAGIPFSPDFNGADQFGVNFYQFTIRDGIRSSSASAFLRPAARRSNLTILTDAHVEHILFNGRQACGIAFRLGGTTQTVSARETILSGGAINSPQLLLLSGIGPAAQLREFGISVVADLPGVGANLHDHLYVSHLSETRARDSINRRMQGWRLLPAALRYLIRRDGLLTIAASQAAAFVKSRGDATRPDLQIMFKPYTLQMSPDAAIVPGEVPGFTTLASPLRPLSRGRLELRTPDPYDAPKLHPNYHADASDQAAMVAGLRIMRRILAAAPLAAMARETVPGSNVESDAQLLEFTRRNAQSMFHPVGTCRMGADPLAVVDARLRVQGIAGLRVADASIMPTIVSGNTNAASIMIGEKAARMILEDGLVNRPCVTVGARHEVMAAAR
jgi:choline dehydrogenase